MGVFGFILGKTILIGVSGGIGFIVGGPIGAAMAMSEACAVSHAVDLALLVSPL